MIYFLLLFLINYSSVIVCHKEEFVEQIKKSPGIHFNPQCSIKLINDYLHVAIPIDIEYLKPHIDNVRHVLYTSQHLCPGNKIISAFECQNIFGPLNSIFDDIARDYYSISHLISSKTKRSAWISGVGTIFKHIFGTMDENDAILYGNAIQHLKDNDKKLLELVKQNLIVSKSAISNFNETLSTINKNEERLNDAIENLSSSLTSMTINTDSLLFRAKIQEVFNVLQSSLLNLSYKLEDTVNSILFAKTNTLHPSIITPVDLYNELVSNVKYLSRFTEFPVPLELENINIVLKLSEIISCIIDNKLLFTIKIPLVLISEFKLFKCIPIPLPHDNNIPNSFALIIPSAKYVAVNNDKTSYCILDDLYNCKTTLNDNFICNNLKEFNIVENPICETEIMSKVLYSLPKECKTKFISGDVHFWQSLGNNKWIFTHSSPTRLHLNCENDNFDVTILGTGIVNLKPKCNGYCKDVKLISSINPKIYSNSIHSDFNLINDSCCNFNAFKKFNDTINYKSVKLNTKLDLDKFIKLNSETDSLLDLVNNLNLDDNFEFTNPHSIMFYVSISLFLVFIIYYFCKERCLTFQKKIKLTRSATKSDDRLESSPDPQPRLRIV